MSVKRLSPTSLKKILDGEVREDATCVVKFYSNGCHLCHNLKDYYEELSDHEDYQDYHFFAFNVDNMPEIEKQLMFNGVPTISMVRTFVGDEKPKIKILDDPINPNEKTWYRVSDIRKFIKENSR